MRGVSRGASGGVEFEDGGGVGGEEVVAGEGNLGGVEGGGGPGDGADGRVGVLEGDVGDHGEEVGVVGGEAGGVEEGGDGADGCGFGGGCGVGACVVLRGLLVDGPGGG